MKLAIFFVWLALVAGCGGPPYSLKGTVTFDGAPVPIGEMVLTPDSSAGNKGPGVLIDIKDGKYESPPGKGHVGGAYLVRMTGFDGAPKPGMLTDYRGVPLFADVVEKVDLPAGPATHDFSLTKKKSP